MVNRSRVKTVQTGMQDDNGQDVYSNRTRADLRKLRHECKAKDKQLAKQFQDYMSITDLENFDDPRIIGAANLHFQNKLSIAKIFAKSKYMADDKNAEAVVNEAVETFGLHSVIAFGNKAAAKLKGFNQSVAMAFQPYVEKMCEKYPSWENISKKVTAAAMGGRYPLKPDFAADMRIAWDIKYHNDCIANKNDPDKLKELKEQYNSNIEKLTVLSERDGVEPADLSKAYSSRIIERMTIDPSIKNIYNNMALGYTMQLKSEPVIDKKTGKQVVDRNGNKRWNRPTEFVIRNGDAVDAWNDIKVSEPPTIDSVVRLYNDRFTQLENDSPSPKNVRDVNAMLNSNEYKGVENSLKDIIKNGGFSAEERKELKYKIEYYKREMLINYGEMYKIDYLANLRHMKPWEETNEKNNNIQDKSGKTYVSPGILEGSQKSSDNKQIDLNDTYTGTTGQEGSQELSDESEKSVNNGQSVNNNKPVNLDKSETNENQSDKPVEDGVKTKALDKESDNLKKEKKSGKSAGIMNQDMLYECARALQEKYGRKLWDSLSKETQKLWYMRTNKICSYISVGGKVVDCGLPDSKMKKYVDFVNGFVRDNMKWQVQDMESFMTPEHPVDVQAPQTTAEQKDNVQAPQATKEQKDNVQPPQTTEEQKDNVQPPQTTAEQKDNVQAPPTVDVTIEPANDPNYNEANSASGTHIKFNASNIPPSEDIEKVANEMAKNSAKNTKKLNDKAKEAGNRINKFNNVINNINVPEPVNTGASFERGN